MKVGIRHDRILNVLKDTYGRYSLPQINTINDPSGRLQTSRFESRLPAVGHAQEQAGHEL